MRAVYFISILAGSFLLFLVQPMMAKKLLPYVGGAPAVWIVSMLFFQVLLLAGYGYSALGSAFMRPKMQLYVHIALFVVAIALFIPLQLSTLPGIESVQRPEIWSLSTLLLSVGLPYFLLSSNATLIQRWYHFKYHNSPYFLFSISNIGSLVGLLGYPFALEWMLSTTAQLQLWSGLFVALVIGLCAIAFNLKGKASEQTDSLGKNLPSKQIAWIILLGFIPSSLFLSTTLWVTTDIASFPLLWVIPLSLYLVSFIISFSKWGDLATGWTQKLHIFAAIALVVSSVITATKAHYFILQMVITFGAFFVLALSCHGRAAQMKPEPNRLTAYYFWLSVGGALGGLVNTIAPYIFDALFEHYLTLILSLIAVPAAHYKFRDVQVPLIKKTIEGGMMLVITAAMSLSIAGYFMYIKSYPEDALFVGRTFFGVSEVSFDEEKEKIVYSHGTTIHGFQPTDEAQKLNVISYYAPIKKLLDSMPSSFFEKPFGIVGLGAGTGACFGRAEQQLDFFEIDRLVIEIAENPEFFTYLRDCPPNITTILGDGRIELNKKPDATYKLLVMDAFTSDAVPVHLLTQEAVGEYIQKLVPNEGILAFNTSNRYLHLAPVLAKHAQTLGWRAFNQGFGAEDLTDIPYAVPSEWVLLLPPNSPWRAMVEKSGFEEIKAGKNAPHWTDDYSNMLSVIK